MFDGYSYEYDKQNRISEIKKLGLSEQEPGTITESEMYSYEYDKSGQLVRCNDKVANKSYTYTYDGNGNILTKSEYAYTTGVLGVATDTTTYTYDSQWKDKLTTVGDKIITYDSIGNPMSYLGATLTWEGRQLTSYSNDEYTSTYEYDENGMRYRTTVLDVANENSAFLEYVWADDKLVSLVYGDDSSTNTAKYLYNEFDEPIGMVLSGETGSPNTYYYLKNAQGDITAIVDASGKKQVSFTYDVFGKVTESYYANTTTIAGMFEYIKQKVIRTVTPFGYRGYCYDTFTGLYYLQSRYYDPNVGRFINADDTNYLNATGTVLGCNLFAYCENDPVNKVDPKGTKSKKNTSYATVYIIYFTLLLSTYDKAFVISSDNNKKGKIKIELEKVVQGKNLSTLIYSFYKLIGEKVFDVISIYVCSKFEEDYYKIHNNKHKKDTTKKRPFLFSDNCVSKEIREHVIGYWYSTNVSGIKINHMSVAFRTYAKFKTKDDIKSSCKNIDIAEQDAIVVRDRTAFGYFTGIRKCYMYTAADPYAMPVSSGGTIFYAYRTYQNVRGTWKNSKILT